MTGADAQAAFAYTLVDEWARSGATDAVVAPGSRSTPLLVALAGEERIRLHVVLDERSAGFVALGFGAASGRPALVVTTSGTAAVELHPAVVEAHHAGVPLLAVTADRPPELHHVGAPQTVEQDGLYGSSVRFAASPGVADLAACGSWRSLAARAWASALAGPPAPGPVHLNLAFREPLLASDDAAARALVPAGRGGCRPWHDLAAAQATPPPDAIVVALAAVERGLIVAGQGSGDPAAVADLATATGWPVLADPRSACRVPRPGVIAAADALLRAGPVAGWRPDLVLRLGRPWASKVVGAWLAGLGPEVPQFLVDPHGAWVDPDRQVGLVVAADPGALCRAVASARGGKPPGHGPGAGGPGASGPGEAAAGAAGAGDGRGDVGWLGGWRRAESLAQEAIESTLQHLGPRLTEPGIARTVAGALPDGAVLVASSSMPVRDVEWFAAPRTGVRVLANRGANGIDGVVSTVIGAALAAAGAPVVGLLGDLAFLYDAGGLLGAAGRGVDCTLVVVDNDGGGIFSFLPQATALATGTFERLWGTPHRLDLAAVSASYGVPTTVVDDLDALATAVTAGGAGVRVVLARTDRAANVAVHERLNAAVAGAVSLGLVGY